MATTEKTEERKTYNYSPHVVDVFTCELRQQAALGYSLDKFEIKPFFFNFLVRLHFEFLKLPETAEYKLICVLKITDFYKICVHRHQREDSAIESVKTLTGWDVKKSVSRKFLGIFPIGYFYLLKKKDEPKEPKPDEGYVETVKLVHDLSKHLTTLAAGVIVVMATFYERLHDPQNPPAWRLLLSLAMISFGISIITATKAQAINANRIYRDIVDEHTMAQFFQISWYSFYFAVACLCIFAVRNIGF